MGDKFYLILDGIVGVWKSFSKEVKFTPEEYLNHLFNLKSKNENYILKKTIKANIIIFPIDIKYLDETREAHFQKIICNLLITKNKIEDMKKILDNYEEFKLQLNWDNNIDQIKQEILKLIRDKKGNSKDNEINKILNSTNREPLIFIIFEQVELVMLHKGKYFGDVALERNKTNNQR